MGAQETKKTFSNYKDLMRYEKEHNLRVIDIDQTTEPGKYIVTFVPFTKKYVMNIGHKKNKY